MRAEDSNITLSAALAAVHSAFEGVRLDGGVSLVQARAMDDYQPVPPQSDENDARWQDVTDETLRNYNDVHPFLCARSFRFYIPAFMSWILRHLDDVDGRDSGLADSAIFFLIPSNVDFPETPPAPPRFSLLSHAQRHAISLFLRYVSANSECHRPEAEQAINDFWGDYCSAGVGGLGSGGEEGRAANR